MEFWKANPRLQAFVAGCVALFVFRQLSWYEGKWFRWHCLGDLASQNPCSFYWIPHYVLPLIIASALGAIIFRPRWLLTLLSSSLHRMRSAAQNYCWSRTDSARSDKLWLCGVGALAGFALFFVKFGWVVLDPTDIRWLCVGDRAQAYLGWSLFRAQPWTFPLGDMPNLMWPEGTNVGYTDPVMLLALIFKLISPWLPNEFQYFGMWLLLCYVLQGAAAGLLATTLPGSLPGRMLASLFLTVSPVLLFRWGHFTLSAHFLVLLSLYLHIKRDMRYKKRISLHFALIVLSACLHPYLTFMLGLLFCGLTVTGIFRQEVTTKDAAVWLFCLAATCIFIWWAVGYVGWLDFGPSPPFGEYGLNLLAFVNPLRFSLWLPGFVLANPKQYEGFAYFGLGGIILLMVCGLYRLKARRMGDPWWVGWYHPTTITCIALAILAIGDTIALGPLGFSLNLLSVPVTPFLGSFRSSGRLVWPVFYILWYVLLRYLLARMRTPARAPSAALIVLLVVQISDIRPLWRRVELSARASLNLPSEKAWNTALMNKNKLLFFPPYGKTYRDKDDFRFFWNLLRGKDVKANFGYVSRYSCSRARDLELHMRNAIEAGRKDTEALYVTTEANMAPFQKRPDVWRCRSLDGYRVCE